MKFISDMLALGTVPAYASLFCMGVFVFYVIWHALRGFRRGIFKQLFHTAFVIISAVVAFIGANSVGGYLLNVMDGRTVDEIAAMVETNFKFKIPENVIEILSTFDLQALEHVLMLPLGVIVLPFVFMAIFFVVNLVLKFLYLFTVGMFKLDMGKNVATKVPGLGLGIVEGVVVATMVLLPFGGVADIAEDAYDMIVEANEERGFEETKAEKTFKNYLQPFSDNPILQFVDSIGNDIILDNLATFEDGDTKLNMREEVSSVIRFSFVDLPALKGTNWMELTEKDKVVIDDIVDFVSESDYKASIVAEILSSVDHFIDLFGVSDEDGSADVIVAFFGVFDNIDREDLPGVLKTFKEFYFHASDGGILNGFASGDRVALTVAFTKKDEEGKTSMEKTISVLESNERTAPLVTTLTKMTITVLSQSVGLDENAITKYNDMRSDLSSTLSSIDKTKTKEEQVADVSSSLAESFEKNGMHVETGAIDKMAEHIVENYSESSELTDEEFNDIMLNYYQANKDNINTDTNTDNGAENEPQ